MFGKTTFTSVPESIVNSQNDGMVYYMADLWHGCFKLFELQSQDTVIEVAPGTSAKIGQALKKCNFEGVLYIVDPFIIAMEEIVEKYQQLLPGATIHPLICTITDALKHLPKKPDFLVANHPIDDMLLSTLSENITKELFDFSSKTHQEIFHVLKSAPSNPISSVFSTWKKVIDCLEPKTAIISQYPSLTLKQNGVDLLNEYASVVINRLKSHYSPLHLDLDILQALLNNFENYNDIHIGTELLNAKNWMALRGQF